MKSRWTVRVLQAVLWMFLLLCLVGLKTAKSPQPSLPLQSVPSAWLANLPAGSRLVPPTVSTSLLLLVYWASWSQPAREQLLWVDRLWHAYRGLGLSVMLVSLDTDLAPVQQFLQEQHLGFPVQLAPPQALAGEHLAGIPTVYLLAAGGRRIKKYEGLITRPLVEAAVQDQLGRPELPPIWNEKVLAR